MILSQKYVRDFSASLVVFLVALPLCMGIALASGAPPAKGLITGIIGGLVVGFLAGSPLQVSGPAAGLAVLVFEIIHEQGYAALAPILIIAGLVQLLAGGLKLGRWFRAISPAVIHGMLAGIGLLIVFQQFHVMLDNKPKGSGLANLQAIPSAVVHGLFPLGGSSRAALLGSLTIAVMLLWERFRPERLKLVPGALLGITAASLTAMALHLQINHVQVPDNLLKVIEFPTMAGFKGLNTGMIGSALALALIASAETLLSAAAVSKMQPAVKTDYDRELMAQGVGNTLCGLVGAIPMTGVIVRSSANVQAGATSRLSAILHGVWILATVVLLASVLRAVPVSSLAGVLVLTGLKLVKVKDIRHLATFGWVPIVIYVATGEHDRVDGPAEGCDGGCGAERRRPAVPDDAAEHRFQPGAGAAPVGAAFRRICDVCADSRDCGGSGKGADPLIGIRHYGWVELHRSLLPGYAAGLGGDGPAEWHDGGVGTAYLAAEVLAIEGGLKVRGTDGRSENGSDPYCRSPRFSEH